MGDLFSYLNEKEINKEEIQLLLNEEPPRLVIGYVEKITSKELIVDSTGMPESILLTSILGYPQGDL